MQGFESPIHYFLNFNLFVFKNLPSMKFLNIQILRALAAGLVVYVHAIGTYGSRIDSVTENHTVELGNLGVKLFFCISGFIIFNSSSRLSGGFQSSLEFFIKRCIRIIPLYWIATSIYAVKLSFQGNLPSAADFIRSLLFIPYADSTGSMRPVLGQGWTLNFEMLFYAMTAVLLLSRSRLRYHMLIAGLAIAVVSSKWLPVPNANSFFSASLITTNLLLFFMGGLIVGMYPPKASNYLNHYLLRKLPPFVLALALLAVAIITLFTLDGFKLESYIFWIELFCCSFAVYMAAIPNEGVQTLTGKRLLGLLVVAGNGSYATYLLHGFVMGPAARLMLFFKINLPLYAFSLSMVIICTIVGIYCYKYFELPLQRALSKILIEKTVSVHTSTQITQP